MYKIVGDAKIINDTTSRKGKNGVSITFRGFYVYRMNKVEFNMEKNPNQCGMK